MSRTVSPRVAILLFTYNQAETAGEALRSCLAQTGEPVEIVASDDASSDETYAILQREAAAYVGPHRVRVQRNAATLGIPGHYNRLVDQTTSELLVTAAGDDISAPDRVARLLQAWDSTGRKADLVSSHVTDLAADGTVHGVLQVDDLGSLRRIDDWSGAAPRCHRCGARVHAPRCGASGLSMRRSTTKTRSWCFAPSHRAAR